ncbi:MAG: globin domain-containing protein [Paracoccaceae bacterium]
MDEANLALLKRSWRRLAPLCSILGPIFHGRLLASAPHLRPLFAAGQFAELIDILAVVVEASGREAGRVSLHRLGRRHAAHDIRPADYDALGEALFWTIETALDGGLSEAERRVWTIAYGVVRDEMLRGAVDRVPTAAAHDASDLVV